MDREGGVVNRRHACRETRPTGVVTVFVPPSVFQEVQTVFDPPVLANMPQEIGCGHLIWIETAYVVACIMQYDFTICRAQLAVDTQTDMTTGHIESLANVFRVV